MRIAGVDDAGRGCVIGPLVIAGAVFKLSDIYTLGRLGVKDSKLLSPKKREELSEEIRKIALQVEYLELQPKEIDRVVLRGRPLRKLNYLETISMAKVLRKMNVDIAYVDPTDVDNNRCARQMKRIIPQRIEIICEPKADRTYLATGAASILAKVFRDKRIEELQEIYGEFGSGYPHDRRTIQFLESYLEKDEELPNFFRKSWHTIRKYENTLKQTLL